MNDQVSQALTDIANELTNIRLLLEAYVDQTEEEAFDQYLVDRKAMNGAERIDE